MLLEYRHALAPSVLSERLPSPMVRRPEPRHAVEFQPQLSIMLSGTREQTRAIAF